MTNTTQKPQPLAKQTIEVVATTPVTLERIAYTLCAALEGGSTYWCRSVKVADYLGYEWAHEAIAAGAPFTFRIDEEEANQSPVTTLRAAVTAMAAMYPRHFKDMMLENEDADTGDVLFQLLCFGEIVYG